MPNQQIELNPIDFITVGTIGPRGQRTFHLQSGKDRQLISLTIEKEQARALGEAIEELLGKYDKQHPEKKTPQPRMDKLDMDLREPIEPVFRVAQMGLGYDEEHDQIVLVAQELLMLDPEQPEIEETAPSVVRFWGSREQMRALAIQASDIVSQGRADPKQNGRLTYYWT
jgi:uncharacterized repeat protein (TIGR03847 family)